MQVVTIVPLILASIIVVTAWDHHEEHHAAIPYKYEYGVKDPHTHDHKDAWEHSDGHAVKGGYKFDEADGTHRHVEYHSDGKGGTNTIVKRVGHAYHPEHHGHDHGHGDQGHGHGHASSYANYNQYPHGHHH